MTLYFPLWLAYVVYLVLGASLLYLLVWIEIQCWFQFCEAFVKAFRYKRAFILFLKHHEYRELYGEMEDWRQKYKELLYKTLPSCDGKGGPELDAAVARMENRQ